ncbi:hypothetical protein LSH36_69g04043 [Paralvinella palmiformis]|uniref:Uncharacterized protein n=1 Tax=Paralvinella palmiformis TaxID=53620 RepID=A0AAD9K3G2_9ANNE|nr:hypothetical protein LSH36_69g04043 [Paralvinella palmiformis]
MWRISTGLSKSYSACSGFSTKTRQIVKLFVSDRKMSTADDGFVEFTYTPGHFRVTPEMKRAFDCDGAVIVRKLLIDAEVKKITDALESNESVLKRAWDLADGTGTGSRLVIWNNPGHDITGMVARARKVAQTCEDVNKLLITHTYTHCEEVSFNRYYYYYYCYYYYYYY